MKRVIICLILVLVLASQAYGFGRRGGDAPSSTPVFSGGSVTTNTVVAPGTVNGVNGETNGNNGKPVSVPEPATLLLLGAGLVGLYGLRKKIKRS